MSRLLRLLRVRWSFWVGFEGDNGCFGGENGWLLDFASRMYEGFIRDIDSGGMSEPVLSNEGRA